MLDGITIEKDTEQHKMPRVVVVGVGGGGSNAVKNMIEQNLEGCEFCVCNTDSQALYLSPCDNKFLLGKNLTNGLGAGGNPDVGRKAAEENIQQIEDFVDGADMVFLSVGMGGGTGTGASPVIAEMIKNKNIVCVGVVSKPFSFENSHRMKIAEAGIEELQHHVDTLIVIPNENLISLVPPDATFTDALKTVDDVLLIGVRAVADLMLKPGQINLDFNDIRTVVEESGKAIIGIGEVSKSEFKENTAQIAAERAISNSLLEYNNIGEARAILVNVTASQNLSFMDMTTACDTVRQSVHPDAQVIFGMSLNDDSEFTDKIRLSVLATGISNQAKATGTTQIGQELFATPADISQAITSESVSDADTPADDSLAYLNDLQSIDSHIDSPIDSHIDSPAEMSPVQQDEESQQNMADTDNMVSATENAPEPSETGRENTDIFAQDTTDVTISSEGNALSITPQTAEDSVVPSTPSADTNDQGDDDFALSMHTPNTKPEQESIYDAVDSSIDQVKSDSFNFDQNDPKKDKSGGLFSNLFNRKGVGKNTQKSSSEASTTDNNSPTTELPDFLKNQRD